MRSLDWGDIGFALGVYSPVLKSCWGWITSICCLKAFRAAFVRSPILQRASTTPRSNLRATYCECDSWSLKRFLRIPGHLLATNARRISSPNTKKDEIYSTNRWCTPTIYKLIYPLVFTRSVWYCQDTRLKERDSNFRRLTIQIFSAMYYYAYWVAAVWRDLPAWKKTLTVDWPRHSSHTSMATTAAIAKHCSSKHTSWHLSTGHLRWVRTARQRINQLVTRCCHGQLVHIAILEIDSIRWPLTTSASHNIDPSATVSTFPHHERLCRRRANAIVGNKAASNHDRQTPKGEVKKSKRVNTKNSRRQAE